MTLQTRYLTVVSPIAPIDADALRVLEMARASGRPPIQDQTPEEARQAYARGRKAVAAAPQPVALSRDIRIAGPDGSLGLRLYRAQGSTEAEMLPVLLYFHGGGWVLGDLESHDAVCRGLANAGRCAVVAVDYRLAPEHRFPAALEDGIAALRWLHDHSVEFRVDPRRIAVGGDSAGGNLAAVLALLGRDRAVPACCFQVLIYPSTDLTLGHEAHRRPIEDLALTAEAMRWFRAQYLGSAAESLDWRASPLHAPTLRGAPPAFVVTVGHDPLSDEGEAYATRLRDEGVPVIHRHLPDQIHGFLAMGGVIRRAGVVIEEIGASLDAHWASDAGP
ncbi:alpha/beta hydrolase [Roseococcus sp.]|uniref:alpha/beta hydrolase n=1 Tax=Roseococcus sp. TaxID=2109646 RepID=UPI003BA950BB